MNIPDEVKDQKDGGNASDGGPAEQDDKFAKLSEQVENLNKGIATSREEAKQAKAESEALKKQLEEFKGKVEFEADDETVELHPEDVKKLQAWARKQGLVTKDELDAQAVKLSQESTRNIAQTAVDEFMAAHKEYDDDQKWQAVQKEFSLYKQPTTLAEYRKILNRIHKDISGDDDEETEARVKAKQANKSRLSLGGGSQASSPSEQAVEDLQKKYPRLSKEQIEERVSELKSLYKK